MGEENGWLGRRDLNLCLGLSPNKVGNHHAEEQLAVTIKVHSSKSTTYISSFESVNMQIILENYVFCFSLRL